MYTVQYKKSISYSAHYDRRSPLMISAAFSATANTLAWMFPRGINGNTLASTTRKFVVPYTFSRLSTTPPCSRGIIAAVPETW